VACPWQNPLVRHALVPSFRLFPVVMWLCLQILQYGRVMRPSLGVVIAPPQALQRIGEKGVLVLDVSSSSHMLLLHASCNCVCSLHMLRSRQDPA
jgi:hypothetical protein